MHASRVAPYLTKGMCLQGRKDGRLAKILFLQDLRKTLTSVCPMRGILLVPYLGLDFGHCSGDDRPEETIAKQALYLQGLRIRSNCVMSTFLPDFT